MAKVEEEVVVESVLVVLVADVSHCLALMMDVFESWLSVLCRVLHVCALHCRVVHFNREAGRGHVVEFSSSPPGATAAAEEVGGCETGEEGILREQRRIVDAVYFE